MDDNLKEFWDLQEVRKYDTFFQQDGALMHREDSLHNGSRAVMPPLIFYTPNSLDHNSIRGICKILKCILQYLAHFSQYVNTPHLAIQNAWNDLPIKTIKYEVDWTLVRVHAILEENWGYRRF